MNRRAFLTTSAAAATTLAFPAIVRAQSKEPIRIGFPLPLTGPFAALAADMQRGAILAAEEVNAKGGVMGGRPLEVLSRDDGGESSNAVTLANQLLAGEGVALLCGTFLSNVGLAVSDFAKQKRVLFVAAEPLSTKLTWEQGNRYTWRLRPSTYMQNAMLANAAAGLDARVVDARETQAHQVVERVSKLREALRAAGFRDHSGDERNGLVDAPPERAEDALDHVEQRSVGVERDRRGLDAAAAFDEHGARSVHHDLVDLGILEQGLQRAQAHRAREQALDERLALRLRERTGLVAQESRDSLP